MPEQTDQAFPYRNQEGFVEEDPKNQKNRGALSNPFEKLYEAAPAPGTFTSTTATGKKGQSTWETHPMTKGGRFSPGQSSSSPFQRTAYDGPTVGGTEMVARKKENDVERGRRASLEKTLARIDVWKEELITYFDTYSGIEEEEKEFENQKKKIEELIKLSLDSKQIVSDENLNDAKTLEILLRDTITTLKEGEKEGIVKATQKLTENQILAKKINSDLADLVGAMVIPSSLAHEKQQVIEALEKLQWLTGGEVSDIITQGDPSEETLDEDIKNLQDAFATLQEALKLQPYRDTYDDLESRFISLQQSKQALVAPILPNLRDGFNKLAYLSKGSSDPAEDETTIKQRLAELTREIETLENGAPSAAVITTPTGSVTSAPTTPDDEPKDVKAFVITTSNMNFENHKKGKKLKGNEKIIGINGKDGKPLSPQEYARDWFPAIKTLIRYKIFLSQKDNVHIFRDSLTPLKNALLEAIEAFDLDETKAKAETLWAALDEAEGQLSVDYEKNKKIIQDLDIQSLPGKGVPYPDSVAPVALRWKAATRTTEAAWEKIDARTGQWEKLTDEENAIMQGPVQQAFTLFGSDLSNFEIRGLVQRKNEILNHVNHRRFAEAKVAAEEFISEFGPFALLNSQDELPDEYNPKKIEKDALFAEVIRWPRSVTLTETKGQTRKNRQTGKDETIRKSWSITFGGKTQQISQEEFDQWNNFKEKTFKEKINNLDAFFGQADRKKKLAAFKELLTLNKQVIDAIQTGDLELASSRVSRLDAALTDAENRWKDMKQAEDLASVEGLLTEARTLLTKTERLYDPEVLARIRFDLKEFEIRERDLKASSKKEGASALKTSIVDYIANLKKQERVNRLSSEFLIVDVEVALKKLDDEEKAVISLIGTTGANDDLEIVQIRGRITRLKTHAAILKTKGGEGKLKDKEVEMLKREVVELSEILRKKETKSARIYGSTVMRPKAGSVIHLAGRRTIPIEQWQQEQNANHARKEAQKDAQRRMDHGTLNNHHERMLQNDKEGYLDMYARKELDRDNPHTAIAHSFLKPVIDEELKAILNNGGPELIEHIQKGGRIHEDILSKFSESIRKSYIQAKLLERDTLLEDIKNLDKQNATPYEVQQRAEMEESIARIDMRLGLLNSITPDYETVQALQKRNTPEIIHKQTYSPEQKPYDKPFSFLRPAYWGGHQKRLRKMALIDVERGKNPEGTYTPTELDRVRLTSVQQARNEKREKVAVGTDDPRPDPLFGADPAEPGTPPTGGTGPQPQGPDTPHTPNTDLDDPFAPNMARSTHSDFADTEPMVFDDEREQPIRPSSPENSQDRAARVSKILDSLTKHLSIKGKWDWRYFAGAVIAGAGLSLATSSRANERGNQERPRTIQEVIMNAPSWREEFVRLDQNHASLLASFNPLKPISFDDLLTEYLENMSLTNPATKDKIANLAIMKVLNERGAGAGLNDEEQQEVSYLVSALMRARYFADHYKNLNARTINTIIGPQDYGEYDYTSVTLRDLYDMAMKAIAEGDRAYEVRTGKKTT